MMQFPTGWVKITSFSQAALDVSGEGNRHWGLWYLRVLLATVLLYLLFEQFHLRAGRRVYRMHDVHSLAIYLGVVTEFAARHPH